MVNAQRIEIGDFRLAEYQEAPPAETLDVPGQDETGRGDFWRGDGAVEPEASTTRDDHLFELQRVAESLVEVADRDGSWHSIG